MGEIAYGFDTAMLLVWLRPLEPGDDRNKAGVLCARHADAMVLPRDWSLDDARDAVPRLFPARRAPQDGASAVATGERRRRAGRSRRGSNVTQLHLEPVPSLDVPDLGDSPAGVDGVAALSEQDEATVTALTGVSSVSDPDATLAIPWRPDFDADDDLDGALDAATPLLNRAFRAGARRKT